MEGGQRWKMTMVDKDGSDEKDNDDEISGGQRWKQKQSDEENDDDEISIKTTCRQKHVFDML